jgi:aspartyl-tRNA(Asn)/glutamyl-tRNA(Gln) amidotransferase subunit C
MSLTNDEVRHLATLARLGLTDGEADRLQHQLSDILDYFARLAAVDTEGVAPTAYPLDLHNITRDDEPAPPLDPESTLANAPRREGDHFRVRAVLEE